MPLTPGGRFSPGDSDEYDLTTDLAAMQVSNEAATANEIAAAISGQLPTRFIGTNAQRLALAAPQLRDGIEFRTTDTNLTWERRGGTWFLAPGQVIASMVGPTTNTAGAAGTLVGSIVSTPVLPIGQRIKIVSSFGQFNSGAAGISVIRMNWRNNATDVSYSTFDGETPSRAYSPSSNSVVSGGRNIIITTTANAKVSAALWINGPSFAVYGLDGTHLWIETV